MITLTIDFETRWSAKYTLKKLTMAEYIRDERFKAFMCGVKVGSGETRVFSHEQLPDLFGQIDWTRTCVIAQNAPFDGAILEWVYGVHPAFYMDLKYMSQWVFGKKIKNHSLAGIAKKLNIGEKGKELAQSKGLEELPQDIFTDLAGYCKNDVNMTHAGVQKFLPAFPKTELYLIDWSVKCFTRPQIMLDSKIVDHYLKAERRRKREELTKTGYTLTQIRSSASFKDILEGKGVDVGMKDGKNGPIPAFAKTDDFMRGLVQHPVEEVRQLAAARLSLRSTFLEGRLSRFKKLAEVAPDGAPVLMNYCGAQQTARWSGGDKNNFQNLGKRGALKVVREAVVAPPGYLLVAGDLSQIEARCLDMLAGNEQSIRLFREGHDPYIPLAAQYYNKPVNLVTPEERAFGKVLKLAAGYQMGGPKFFETCKNWGVEGVSEDEAKNAIKIFRQANAPVVQLWDVCHKLLICMADGTEAVHESMLFQTVKNGVRIIPTGFEIKYPRLRQVQTERGYSWEYYDIQNGYWSNIYGGKIVENIVQHLAGRVVADHLLMLQQQTGYSPAFMVHDELVFVVPEDSAQGVADQMRFVMSQPPAWWPDLPVACEVAIGPRYSDVK